MALGNIGRVIAGQAMETTKKSVIDSLRGPETAKSAEKIRSEKPAPAPATENIGSVILGQMQAMQRALKEDQELVVLYHSGHETLRVLEIFVPSVHVLVLAGVDAEQNVTRVVLPAEAAHMVFKVMKTPEGATPIKVNVLSPRPTPAPAPTPPA